MTLFDKIIPVILKNEGGFTQDPNDPGNYANGELKGTNYGISAASYPTLDIKNLTREEAIEIYRKDYWNPLLEFLTDPDAALQIFDMCVNAGTYRAIRMAQYTSKAFEDGILGQGTIKAINASECFVERYKTARIKYYASLQNADRYLKGWTNRVINSKI